MSLEVSAEHVPGTTSVSFCVRHDAYKVQMLYLYNLITIITSMNYTLKIQ